jgi:hypothetical protein
MPLGSLSAPALLLVLLVPWDAPRWGLSSLWWTIAHLILWPIALPCYMANRRAKGATTP